MLYCNFVAGRGLEGPRRIAILDLDGTLFSDEYRLHHLVNHEYDEYQDAALNDPLNTRTTDWIRAQDYDGYLICSGRYAHLAPATLNRLPLEITKRVLAMGMRERLDDAGVGTVALKASIINRFKCEAVGLGWERLDVDLYDDDERVLKYCWDMYHASSWFRLRRAFWVNRYDGCLSEFPFVSGDKL